MRKTLSNGTALVVSAMPNAFASTPVPEPKTNKPRVEPQLTAIAKIDMPTRVNKRGSVSIYPFADLTEVGMAFGVKNKTATTVSSIVSNANRKALAPVTDAAGNPTFDEKELTGADGTKTMVPDSSKPKMRATKHFYAVDVDAALKIKIKGTALEGSTVLIFRDA